MERPFQFTDDRDGARSPFNQQLLNNKNGPAQPTNFKTNVNRSKTRKWAEAKNYSYDGDDWGGYDPYDEYGSYDDNAPAPAPASGSALAPAPILASAPRRNSFERGDESAAFSSTNQAPVSSFQGDAAPHADPTMPNDDHTIRRDFSQLVHVPPPLQTRTSPNRDVFPARKSSMPTSPPRQQPIGDDASSPSTSSPRPFVRPADIYKRMEEERSRGQQNKRSPSISEPRTQEHQGFTVDNPILARAIGANVSPTSSVSDHGALPTLNRVASGFGSDFWKASDFTDQPADVATVDPVASESPAPAEVGNLHSQPSLRTAVNQAFDRQDDGSIPPTPVSRDNSQSGHSSDTSGISPIMSRVPSAATAEAKARLANSIETVPTIAEESSIPPSPASRPSSQAHTLPRKPSPAHSRNVSSGSLIESPAKTPQLEYTKRLSTPMAAESTSFEEERSVLSVESPSHPVHAVRVIAPSADYSQRESDIAADVSSSSPSDTGAAAQTAQTQFLQTHHQSPAPSPTSPILRSTSPITRTGSPGPGRVRDLAGKFNELQSRSSSPVSLRSKNSNMSLRRAGTFESNYSQDAESPTKSEQTAQKSLPRPDATHEPSFRPHLPGEWVSYVGTSASETAPRPQPEEITNEGDTDLSAGQHEATTPKAPAPARSASDFDLTPSTVKQPLAHKDITSRESSPIEAVKAAGDALGAALLGSYGQNHGAKDFAQKEPPQNDVSKSTQDAPRPSVGDIYLRPLAVERTASSVASSVAPTPPPKDTPEGLNLHRSSGYFPAPVLRVQSDIATPASEYSPDGMESDRLRREIERSLTPQSPSSAEQQTRDQDALEAPDNLRKVQLSEGLLSPAVDTSRAFKDNKATPVSADAAPRSAPSGGPGLLDKRFSWEKDNSALFGEEGDKTEPRASYERPKSSAGLHVVNTNISSSSSSVSSVAEMLPVHEESQPALRVLSPAPHEESEPSSPVPSPTSPVTSPDIPTTMADHERTTGSVAMPPVDLSTEHDNTSKLPLSESPVDAEVLSAPTTAAPSSSVARIPPFREILALKSAHERIATYDSTRDQFASMDSGLQNWLSTTISSRPEHNHLLTDDPNKLTATTTMGSIRKSHPPNILKIAKGLGSSSREPSGSYSADPTTANSGVPRTQSQAPSSLQQHGGVEKMSTKGKDLLHSAGMLSGKATFGAKGLFAKAKGRLREGGNSEKASARHREPRPDASPAPIEPPTERSVTPQERSRTPQTEDMNRSRSNSRFSTALSRFRSGSRTRPSSLVLSPGEGPTVVISSNDKPPTELDLTQDRGVIAPWSDEKAVLAPWSEEKETVLDKKYTENETIKRLGVLPSPVRGSMISQETAASSDNIPDVQTIKLIKPDTETDKTQIDQAVTANDGEVVDVPAIPGSDETIEGSNKEEVVPSKVDTNGQSLQTPEPENAVSERQPPAILVNPRHLAVRKQSPEGRSPVSSLAVDDRNFGASGTSTTSVSPISTNLPPTDSPAQLPMPKHSESEVREDASAGSRPPLIGRGSLPSQQRQSESRQPSWDVQGNTAAPGIRGRPISAQFGSKPNSRGVSRSSQPPSRTASPSSFTASPQKQTRGPTPAGQCVVGAEPPPVEISQATYAAAHASYSTGQIGSEAIVQSPVDIQPQQDVFYASPMPPAQAAQRMPYMQPTIMGREDIIHEDPRTQQFSPAVMDPRQHGIEYTLPGVGPPEDLQNSRRKGLFRSSMASPPPANERINPGAVAPRRYDRTFSGDEIPQTQAVMEKKQEKRRSGMFGSFSRTSSVSAVDNISAVSGPKTPQSNMQQAYPQQDPASPAAQQAKENTSKSSTPKRLQRSSTSAGGATPDPEKKLNRFSRLGSIFRRSSSSESKRGNKLVKTMPKTETIPEPAATGLRVQERGAPQNVPALPQAGNVGSVEEEYEAQQWAAENGVRAPPGGWYAPTSRRSSYNGDLPQPTVPQIQPTMEQPSPLQQTRRLHSEGFRHGPRYSAPSDYRSMSPSPLRGQRGSQQFEVQPRVGSYGQQRGGYGPTHPPQHQPSPNERSVSWGTQQDQQYLLRQAIGGDGSPVRRNASPLGTPSHSRHASLNSMTVAPPPMTSPPPHQHSRHGSLSSITEATVPSAGSLQRPQVYRNQSSGSLQRASEPVLYGQSQAYQVPPPRETRKADGERDWEREMGYGYLTQQGQGQSVQGPAQQASMPGMYANRGYEGGNRGYEGGRGYDGGLRGGYEGGLRGGYEGGLRGGYEGQGRGYDGNRGGHDASMGMGYRSNAGQDYHGHGHGHGHGPHQQQQFGSGRGRARYYSGSAVGGSRPLSGQY